MSDESGPPGVPLSSGFDYVPIEDTPFALTYQQQVEWDAWVAENRRCHLRAMEAASHYVIGSGRVKTKGECSCDSTLRAVTEGQEDQHEA